MAGRRKWRTVVDGAAKSHQSEPATYQWIHDQPQGTIVRVEVNDGLPDRWAHYETVEANG